MRSIQFAGSFVLGAVLAAAVPARAADPGSYKPPPPKAPTAAPAKPSRPPLPEDRVVLRSKNAFILAAELCLKKDTCDQEMLRSTEKKFLALCEGCADPVVCADEREAILGGKGNAKFNPCAKTATAAAEEKQDSKKGPSAAELAMKKRVAEREGRKAAPKPKPTPTGSASR